MGLKNGFTGGGVADIIRASAAFPYTGGEVPRSRERKSCRFCGNRQQKENRFSIFLLTFYRSSIMIVEERTFVPCGG